MHEAESNVRNGDGEPAYDILALGLIGDRGTRILKHDELFGVFATGGDVLYRGGASVHGLYFEDMRHLSHLAWEVGGRCPLILNSYVGRDDAVLRIDMTNPDQMVEGTRIKAERIHVRREKFLADMVCHERLMFLNFDDRPHDLPIEVSFKADFMDVFEIRGTRRDARGRLDVQTNAATRKVRFVYEGLDGVTRVTEIGFDPMPDEIDTERARFRLHLEPHERRVVYSTVSVWTGEVARRDLEPGPETFVSRRRGLRSALRGHGSSRRRIRTSNRSFDDWVERSCADTAMLTTELSTGPYPYAGTPWFNTVFGRDGIITALEGLWVDPSAARGVLSTLASLQAAEVDPVHEAEPGKIVHEIRRGEMARTGEVPFRRYYGSVDATPLFVVLAGELVRTTGDLEFVQPFWPNIRDAIDWIDRYGDPDGDGYVEYGPGTSGGLIQQGWKDSHDSVFHADGRDADLPIALCEVQAYVYGARLAAADIAELRGEDDFAAEQRSLAATLAEQFRRDFWLEDLGMYALALDAHKKPCAVRSSNTGHCLLTGLAAPEHAERIAETVMSNDMYSGWGIRTIGRNEARFNPMSYHNGSIWPHDNALIALGLSRYGFSDVAARIAEGLFLAANSLDHDRLPELFCGFAREEGQQPTLYPVACVPQAWSAGSVFMLIQSFLGLEIDGLNQQVLFRKPTLPESLDHVRLDALSVGDATATLIIRRHPNDVGIEVLRRDGDFDITVLK